MNGRAIVDNDLLLQSPGAALLGETDMEAGSPFWPQPPTDNTTAAATAKGTLPTLPALPREQPSAVSPGQGIGGDDEEAGRGAVQEQGSDSEEPEGDVSYTVLNRWEMASSIGNTGNQGKGAVKLFVGVLTAGKNADRRDAIRETWGSDPRLHR